MKLVEPTAVNYRGERLSVRLGICLGSVTVLLLVGNAIDLGPLAWTAIGAAAVFLAGLYDDSRPHRTRGMRTQLAAVARGEVTPGVVKLVVIAGASAFSAWMLGARGLRLVAATAVVAGCANLLNLLDVRPGRALKLFIPSAVALGAATFHRTLGLYWELAGAAAVALWFDLRERFMVGDCGANVLGFVIGIGILLVLPAPWLWAVLAVLVVLHVLADTVTLSRLIDAAPPLRFLDRLGRKKFAENG